MTVASNQKDQNSKLTALKPDTRNIETIAMKETDTYLSLGQETTDFLISRKVLTLLDRQSHLQVKTNRRVENKVSFGFVCATKLCADRKKSKRGQRKMTSLTCFT